MLPEPFDSLPESARRAFEMPAGKALFRRDDRTRGMFFLVSGQVDLERVTDNGDPVVIHRVKPGETFAEASLFSDVYHCDAISRVRSHVVELQRGAVLRHFNQDGGFATALAGRFATQVQAARRRFELLTIRSAEERVFAAVSDGLLDGSIKAVAAEIGLTHEATYRALARLVSRGMLQKTGRGCYSLASP